MIQNGSPYTFFGDRSVEMAEGASLDSGDLAGLILKRTSPLDIPSIAWRALSPHASVVGHRQIEPFSAQKRLRIRSLDDRALPVQVDGDFIGSATEHSFSVAPARPDGPRLDASTRRLDQTRPRPGASARRLA